MSRYIDADALCKELKKRQNAAYNWSSESRAINDLEGEIRSDAVLAMLSEVKLTIDAQPTANVRKNVTGKWVEEEYGLGCCSATCSACREREDGWAVDNGWGYDYYFHRYCPNCGAKMEGAGE